MSLDESSPPSAKQAKIVSACEIKDLSDADLTEIFKHLPPLDRLFISAVCKLWNGISRAVWADVTHLDLGPIPGRQIAPIVSQCPNLQTVVARDKIFALDELHILARMNLNSLKLYDCEAAVLEFGTRIYDAFSLVFSSNLRSASWHELVLHNFLVNVVDLGVGNRLEEKVLSPASSLPAALKRLQISGRLEFRMDSHRWFDVGAGLRDLEQLQNLDCLTLSVSPVLVNLSDAYRLSTALLTGLRELYLGGDQTAFQWRIFAGLAKLEVLLLDDAKFGPVNEFVPLVTKHPTLRILILTGDFFGTVTIPVRIRYPNGLSVAPVPTLHVFVGKETSENIRFPSSSNDTLKIFPISEPLPRFLERADIAPIFQGVALAAEIIEAAKHGDNLSNYAYDVATSIRHADV